MPHRILSRVDLPVPLAPTSPVRSLGVISQSQVFEQKFGAETFSGALKLNHLRVRVYFKFSGDWLAVPSLA